MSGNAPKTTLAGVVLRVKHIANEQYDSKVYENIIPIFDQLTLGEKRILLRGLIGICFVVDEKVLEQRQDTVDQYTASERRQGRNTNKSQKKKSKLATIGTYVGTGLMIFLLLGTMFGSYIITGENGLLAKIRHFVSVLKNAL